MAKLAGLIPRETMLLTAQMPLYVWAVETYELYEKQNLTSPRFAFTFCAASFAARSYARPPVDAL